METAAIGMAVYPHIPHFAGISKFGFAVVLQAATRRPAGTFSRLGRDSRRNDNCVPNHRLVDNESAK